MTLRHAQIAGGLFLGIAFGLMAAPACGGSTASGGAGGAGGGANDTGGYGGAGENCDTRVCGNATSGCIACAEVAHCQEQLNACNKSKECQDYGQCIAKCAEGDSACVADCASDHPSGSSAYRALLDCVICKSCPISCDAPGSGCAL